MALRAGEGLSGKAPGQGEARGKSRALRVLSPLGGGFRTRGGGWTEHLGHSLSAVTGLAAAGPWGSRDGGQGHSGLVLFT